jgi:drug/metabolite transporter (DMT)-like permease
MCVAEQTIPSGVTALVIGIVPIFMVLAEWAWPGGQRPSAMTLLGLLLGAAGVAWLAAPWESGAQGGLPLPGVSIVLLACLLWAVGSIYSRHVRNPAPLMLGSALQMVTGGGALLIAAALHGEYSHLELASATARSWWAVVYLITVGSLIGFSTFVWLMRHSSPARVSTYAFVNPIVAVFLGWLILNEPISLRMLLAAALIIGAVVIITLQKAKKKLPTINPPLPASLSSGVERS